MKLENQNIIIVSNEPWSEVWFSKQNYANELARKNKVIFINPVKRWSFYSIFTPPSIQVIQHNLSVLNYLNYIPALHKQLFLLNDYCVAKRLNRFLEKIGYTNIIFWTFDPCRLVNPKRLRAKKSIFHIVDLYSYTLWGEEHLIKNVEYCIFVSEVIKAKYALNARKKMILPHAISSDEFIADDAPTDLPQGKFGLYVGNIDARLDFNHIEAFIRHFPSLPFVFIGGLHEVKEEAFERIFIEKCYQNVFCLGTRPFKQLKNYINASSFCFAYMKNFKWNKIAHHKILLYLAMGKPVFSSFYSDYSIFGDLLYMGDDVNESIDLLACFLSINEDEKLTQMRINTAKEHDFETALDRVEKFIND